MRKNARNGKACDEAIQGVILPPFLYRNAVLNCVGLVWYENSGKMFPNRKAAEYVLNNVRQTQAREK